MYKQKLKSLLDRILAVIMLVILLPLFALLSFVIFASNQSLPFYIQPRPGLNGKIFNLIKFKTMSNLRDSNGNLLDDSKRITRIGSILRKSSLDELPEVINIALGDMSFIGPRPLLVEYLPLYSSEQLKRHNVKPGLTGLAQVNGRNLLGWEEKFALDIKYQENISFFNDLRILAKTFFIIFNFSQINQSKNITMEKFIGTPKRHDS